MDSLIPETTNGFRGEFSFLSNMYPVDLEYNGFIFPSSENIYQWLKSKDNSYFSNLLLKAKNGKEAKRLTRMPNFPITSEKDKLSFMRIALDLKFERDELKDLLLMTDDIELVEYNWWGDTFWGVCGNKGRNVLGNMLMIKREELKNA